MKKYPYYVTATDTFMSGWGCASRYLVSWYHYNVNARFKFSQ